MKIYYVYHSCFIIETESAFLIFDYYKDVEDANQDFDFNELLSSIFKSPKPLYVFSSHGHQDHFNSRVLDWQEEKENTFYILSSDIKLYSSINKLYTAKKNDVFTVNNLTVSSFGSTDQGISFLVEIDGKNIFHAGDLNWWKWMDDTPEEEKEMEDAFKSIIEDIINVKEKIDIAFFPVDGRLEDNYLCGGKYFIEKLKPKVFIPMHFWENFRTTSDFADSQVHSDVNIVVITHSNQILYNIE